MRKGDPCHITTNAEGARAPVPARERVGRGCDRKADGGSGSRTWCRSTGPRSCGSTWATWHTNQPREQPQGAARTAATRRIVPSSWSRTTSWRSTCTCRSGSAGTATGSSARTHPPWDRADHKALFLIFYYANGIMTS